MSTHWLSWMHIALFHPYHSSHAISAYLEDCSSSVHLMLLVAKATRNADVSCGQGSLLLAYTFFLSNLMSAHMIPCQATSCHKSLSAVQVTCPRVSLIFPSTGWKCPHGWPIDSSHSTYCSLMLLTPHSHQPSKVMHFRLPWWLSGKESTCQCKRHRFNPSSGKIPHAAEQLSLCTTTIEPVLWSLGAATTEPMCHNYWSPCSLEPLLSKKRRNCSEKTAHHN